MCEFRNLLQENSLEGWKIYPRGILRYQPGTPEYANAWAHKGQWTVRDGILEGRQDPPGCGLGSYLVSEETFEDFELIYEAKPDWPADTGVYIRADETGTCGYQILLDHRKSGSIGGFYGNAIGGFHAINWNVDAEYDAEGNAVGIRIEDPATTLEPITPDKPAMLQYKISGGEFLKTWKWADWNEFRVLCVGRYPVITTWINGVKTAKIDMNQVDAAHFNREAADRLGTRGHISLEVHDNDRIGEARWGKNAATRFRNIRIREL